MVHRIPAALYYEGPFGPGRNCVLLHTGDDLAEIAIDAVDRIAPTVPSMTFWIVGIRTADEAADVQALWYPGYRWIVDGGEIADHRGVLRDEQLLTKIRELSG